MLRSSVIALAVALVGCGSAKIDDPFAGAQDSGGAVDAAAGSSDAGGAAGGDVATADAGPQDSGAQDAGPQDAGFLDSAAQDSGPQDSGAQDSGAQDSGPQDSGPQDSGPQDSGPQDSGPQDAGPADVGEPACKTAADCAKEAAPTCQAWTCQSGVCALVDADGASCNDGDACSTGDTCHKGACKGGKPLSCVGPLGCKLACEPTAGCTADVAGPCVVYATNPSLMSKLSDRYNVVDIQSVGAMTPFALRSKAASDNTTLKCSLANHGKCLWSENGAQSAHITILTPKPPVPLPKGGLEVVVQLRDSSKGAGASSMALFEWGQGFEKQTENSPTASHLGLRQPKAGSTLSYQALKAFAVTETFTQSPALSQALPGIVVRLQQLQDGNYRLKRWVADKPEPAGWQFMGQVGVPPGGSWRLLVMTGGGGSTGSAQVGSVLIRRINGWVTGKLGALFPPVKQVP